MDEYQTGIMNLREADELDELIKPQWKEITDCLWFDLEFWPWLEEDLCNLMMDIDGKIEIQSIKDLTYPTYYIDSPFDFTSHEYCVGPHCAGMKIPEIKTKEGLELVF